MSPPFIPGLVLSGRYFAEVVRPLLAAHFPDLRYSAARLGGGSDVLGFDTPQSRDHAWGPQLTLFLTPEDLGARGEAVDSLLQAELPATFLDYPTRFRRAEDGVLIMGPGGEGPARHYITLRTVDDFFHAYLRYDVARPPAPVDWLTFPQQRLRTIRHGRAFHDGLDRLTDIRRRLYFYPHDVWLYLLAGLWRRVAQEEAFVGRTGDVGDELGSRLIAGRMVHDLMALCLLMDRDYAPYSKWFGTAFARLPIAGRLAPLLQRVLDAGQWRDREAALNDAYLVAAERHNELGITDPIEPRIAPFHNRPYQVPHADRFVDALMAAIGSQALDTLPPLGGIDHFVDSTDVLSYPARFARLRVMYEA